MRISFEVDNLKKMNSELREFAEYLREKSIPDEDIFASRLVSCELLTNVIRHGGESAIFTGELLSDFISITVTAKSLEKIELDAQIPDVFAESGRGMYIVRCFGEIERCGCDGLRVCIKRHN